MCVWYVVCVCLCVSVSVCLSAVTFNNSDLTHTHVHPKHLRATLPLSPPPTDDIATGQQRQSVHRHVFVPRGESHRHEDHRTDFAQVSPHNEHIARGDANVDSHGNACPETMAIPT